MELTETEKQIIYAYRNGANIDIGYHLISKPEEAIRLINKFGAVETIWDLEDEDIVFKREDKNLNIKAFINGRTHTGRTYA